jgi:hypothetical protein
VDERALSLGAEELSSVDRETEEIAAAAQSF